MKRVVREKFRIISFAIVFMGMSFAARSQQTPPVPPWVKDAIFYQIFPDRFANGDPANDPPGSEAWGGTPTTRNKFGGDLQGIINHLDYLSDLGINAIYLNPIFESGSNHKYNTRDYLRIDPQFGDDETFRRFVGACHGRGIRVILDAVFNHTGVDFFAFADLKKNGKASPYTAWYNVHSYPVGSVQKPNYECWWNHGGLPKLMTENPEVRRYLFDVTKHWMERGIDGWRLDVPNEISHGFWIEWRKLVKSLNPEAYIVGEIWEDGSPWLGGDQFDAVMNYQFRSACVDFFAKRKTSASEFDRTLAKQREAYPIDVTMAVQNLLGSHDTERFLTICKDDTSSLCLAALFQMTYLGAPMIYYGDEVGMKGGTDPGCRGTMVWEPERQDRHLLETYRRLIAVRKEQPVLRTGDFATLLTDDSAGVYAFARRESGITAVIILNNNRKQQEVRIPFAVRSEGQTLRQLWPEAGPAVLVEGSLQTTVPARSGKIYLKAD